MQTIPKCQQKPYFRQISDTITAPIRTPPTRYCSAPKGRYQNDRCQTRPRIAQLGNHASPAQKDICASCSLKRASSVQPLTANGKRPIPIRRPIIRRSGPPNVQMHARCRDFPVQRSNDKVDTHSEQSGDGFLDHKRKTVAQSAKDHAPDPRSQNRPARPSRMLPACGTRASAQPPATPQFQRANAPARHRLHANGKQNLPAFSLAWRRI